MKLFLSYLKILSLFLVFAFANPFGAPYSPFLAALFLALVYCKYNVLLLTPLFLISVFAAEPNLTVLLLALPLPALAYLLYLSFGAFSKSVPTLGIMITGGIGYCAIFFFPEADKLYCAFSLVATLFLTFCAVPAVYAATVKRLGAAAVRVEPFFCSVLMLGIAIFAASVSVMEVSPFYLFATAFTLIFIASMNSYNAILCPIIFGGAAAISNCDFYSVLLLSVPTVLSLVFSQCKRIVYSFVYLIVFCALALFIAPFERPLIPICEVIIAATFFTLLPKKAIDGLSQKLNYHSTSSDLPVRGKLDRAAIRLTETANSFKKLAGVLKNETPVDASETDLKDLCENFALKQCSNCESFYHCYANGATPFSLFRDVAARAIKTGEVEYAALPREIVVNCDRSKEFNETMSLLARDHVNSRILKDSVYGAKLILREQTAENAEILLSLAKEISDENAYDKKTERKLIDEFASNNIVCFEAMIYPDKNNLRATLTVRREDEGKTLLLSTLNKFLKQDMSVEKVYRRDDVSTIDLSATPPLDAVYGYAFKNKMNAKNGGDRKAVKRIGGDKLLAILSDGMGSGTDAQRYSDKAIIFLENMLEAGHSCRSAISLANKYLAVDEDGFSACDLLVVDLRKGTAELMKTGGATTYVIRNGKVDKIGNNRTPLGVLNEISVRIDHVSLDANDGICLISDGISDALTEAEITSTLLSVGISNPQTAAETLLMTAINKKRGNASFGSLPHDDASVLILRFYKTPAR